METSFEGLRWGEAKSGHYQRSNWPDINYLTGTSSLHVHVYMDGRAGNGGASEVRLSARMYVVVNNSSTSGYSRSHRFYLHIGGYKMWLICTDSLLSLACHGDVCESQTHARITYAMHKAKTLAAQGEERKNEKKLVILQRSQDILA